ncbi:HORMA domain-containing protein 1 [Latimeria chalumnae]|uniref:HORMA domain-containing protein 1 n=1 Tax=Latimeria chalumnae TaxID=7897 RepID=UPI0006D913FE|nr:PREDICTED: HORMA domain-containing protein 1 isoform X2 [Latimeria chalumnae]XP_014347038.1 PREDICTED: HORMA domain-containing protein 1 isoform X2 [Latimeria chalumnae]|eukprot:XP_014347037.1 PREDICTED: HORMA domain-containing protein 1 isoform X2 [Latimeria chalumnae]
MSQSVVMFPNKITTEQQSLVLVKRLLAVSVSCITYLRGLFPECAYGTRYIEDLCVKILREDKSCPGSTQIVQWLLGCYDALQKKYLRMIVLALYTNAEDPQTITECYQFKFKYTKDGPVMDFMSNNRKSSSITASADTKKASILLIRKLYVLMQNLGPLPNNVCLTMKLFYYDNVTPPDYQPPGFKEGDCSEIMFEGEPMYLSVGEVTTPFHSLKVKVTTEKDRMEHIDKEVLRKREAKLPVQSIELDKEEQDKQDCSMNEDVLRESQTVEEDKNNISLKAEEMNLVCEEEESINATGCQNPNNTQSQLDQLASKTAELEVSVRKTRSGRIIKNNNAQKNQDSKASRESPRVGNKRGQSVAQKPISQFEIPCSQGEAPVPKKRKLSEPEQHFK